MKFKILLMVLAAAIFSQKSEAQDFALKTNVLYWAATTPNLGAEVALGRNTLSNWPEHTIRGHSKMTRR